MAKNLNSLTNDQPKNLYFGRDSSCILSELTYPNHVLKFVCNPFDAHLKAINWLTIIKCAILDRADGENDD